jgi:UDP-N-acetyl-D-glucosamine/UDP-N-acetyl-D-galactosamine dehydrogenase
VIVAVAHQAFLSRPHSAYVEQLKQGGCFIDVRAQFDAAKFSADGLRVWRL